MPKTRVYELAKELGVDSKAVLSMAKDMGEFVKSPSSTLEAPVIRRLKEKLAPAAAPAEVHTNCTGAQVVHRFIFASVQCQTQKTVCFQAVSPTAQVHRKKCRKSFYEQ